MQTTAVSLLEQLRLEPQDQASWKRLDALYRPLVTQWALRERTFQHDLEDVVQDVMTVVVRELPTFQRQRTGSFRTWLKKITVHCLYNLWRDRQKRAALGPAEFALSGLTDPASDMSGEWDREHDHFVLKRLLLQIESDFAPLTRRAFKRVVLDQQKPADVAIELGISVNAVLLAKSHVLQRLRQVASGLVD